jgi:hypothetical protein
VATVAALYNRPLYSDLTIRTPASSIYAHKFVLRYQGSQGCGSGSGYAWIRISLSCWIRIRILNANLDPDPGGQK